MRNILFILPILLSFSAQTLKAITCPNLNGGQILKFDKPSPLKAPLILSAASKLKDGSCEYSVSPSTGIDEAAREGTLTIKLASENPGARCPFLTGMEIIIKDPSPMTFPLSISTTANTCEFSLDPSVDLTAGFRAGTLTFSLKK